ncbi:MAG TPA: hypothetical protein VKY41_01180 [Xanthomarina sp.]|nr:hypothetical protein [Xanthomarina sp.]
MIGLKQHTIAFYNIENLFEPESPMLQTKYIKWSKDRYLKKIKNLGLAIHQIGAKETAKHPALIGLAEVENETVLYDLTQSLHLKPYNYQYVYFRSLDKRGMNVALLYDASIFTVTASKAYKIDLLDAYGDTDYTRDVLLVTGNLGSEKLHIIINHWPSKREKKTEIKRMEAAKKVGEIIDAIRKEDSEAKVLIMGDFNDDPESPSINYLIERFELYNPMEKLRSYSRGSLSFERHWHLFDQFLLSSNFLEAKPSQWQFESADIFDAQFLKFSKGKHRGRPFRTFLAGNYHGGFSDHFPVYITIKYQSEY